MIKDNNKVLIIDDDMTLLRLLKRDLEEQGYSVDCFHNLAEAINLVQDLSPDIIFLDLKMLGGELNELVSSTYPEGSGL
jgi:DNA-binding response OmpR family regulator